MMSAKTRAIIRLYSRLLAWLLHYANARPASWTQREFYDLKTRLLKRYADFQGHEIQEIRKECWGGYYTGCGPKCTCCGGTGIFDLFWVRLERWQWGRYVFHYPTGRTWMRPESVQIRGRIEHAKYGMVSSEAALWLYLLTGELRLLWRSLKNTCSCGRHIWPLLNLQRMIFWLTHRFAWRKCWCGSVCFTCRLPKTDKIRDEDIPF